MKSLIFILIPIALIYVVFLQKVPVYLNQDELGFSLNAYSIAKTGFDENGRFLPLYFWHLDVMWATPIIAYLTALFLLVFPLSETSIRLPSVAIGLLNISLIFFLAKKLFNSTKFGLLAAIMLATTPVHFIQSRILLDNLFPLPFVLGWMLLVYSFFSIKKLWLLFLAGLLLGVGVHSYHATKVIMPIYVILTLFLIVIKLKEKKVIALSILIISFILPLLPLISWLSQYPDTLTDQVRYTGLYDTRLNPIQGIATLLKADVIFQRIEIYFKYFDPLFLFFKGDASLIHSTGKVGVFLLSFAILLPLGIYTAVKNRGWFNTVLIIGFFTAPFAAALVGNEYRASKELVILPFASLLATLAVKFLLSSSHKIWRLLALILLVIIPLQFTYFLYDYFNDYRARSYNWFNYNIGGSLKKVIDQDKDDNLNSIYLDNGVNFIDRYWRFYLIEYKKESLLAKTYYIDPGVVDIQALSKASLLHFRFDHPPSVFPPHTQSISEPDNFVSFYIFKN